MVKEKNAKNPKAVGLSVFLDVSMRPAPVWVHRLCPGCNIGARSGRPAPVETPSEL